MRKKVNAFEMWCYRRIVVISSVDSVTNESLKASVYRFVFLEEFEKKEITELEGM